MIDSFLKNNTEPNDIPCNPEIDDIFADYAQPTENNTYSIIGNEIRTFQNVQIPYSADFNVLNWWANNKQQFPQLFKVACKILAVPARSAASERAFSVAKNLINNKRCKIATNDDLVNKIMVLHSNINVLYNDSFLEINL